MAVVRESLLMVFSPSRNKVVWHSRQGLKGEVSKDQSGYHEFNCSIDPYPKP